MAIPTNLDIAAVSYNGTNVPLVPGDSFTHTTLTISSEDATTYATSNYTISSITCNYYIIISQKTSDSVNGGYAWLYTPDARIFLYANGTTLSVFALNSTNIRTNSTYSNLDSNGHPVIHSLNNNYPLLAGTYDVLYW